MNKQFTSIALVALFGLSVSGCASTKEAANEVRARATAAVEAATAKPALSAEAQAALTQAEADAKAAKAAFTFWVPAENALKKAQEAAKAFDSATVIKQAKVVSDLCKISANQPTYASTEMK